MKNKKILCSLLLILMITFSCLLVGCNKETNQLCNKETNQLCNKETNQLIDLKDNETIRVGGNGYYKNYTVTTSRQKFANVSFRTYTIQKSTNNFSNHTDFNTIVYDIETSRYVYILSSTQVSPNKYNTTYLYASHRNDIVIKVPIITYDEKLTVTYRYLPKGDANQAIYLQEVKHYEYINVNYIHEKDIISFYADILINDNGYVDNLKFLTEDDWTKLLGCEITDIMEIKNYEMDIQNHYVYNNIDATTWYMIK